LVIAPFTLYLFMVSGSVSFLWCVGMLMFAMLRPTLRISLFPEIDFAAKVARERGRERDYAPADSRSGYSFQTLLSQLSKSDSSGIRKALARWKFFVQVGDSKSRHKQPITIAVEEEGGLHGEWR
jgi:hypothetical protein